MTPELCIYDHRLVFAESCSSFGDPERCMHSLLILSDVVTPESLLHRDSSLLSSETGSRWIAF